MSREHPLAPHRVIPVAVILLLGLVTLLAVKGPDWYKRFYHRLDHEQQIAEQSRAHGLDPYLVAAVINVESEFDAGEVSSKGAVGLMQLMPDTAREVARDNRINADVGVEALKDPELNIRLGTLHLSELTGRYASVEEALAAYNAGAGNANRWRREAEEKGVPFLDAVAYPETRRYVTDVLSQRDTYAQLYPDVFEEYYR